MSARDRDLVILPRAQRDLAHLLAYSERHWGRPRRDQYKRTIDQALNALTRFPHLGRPRDDVDPGLRSRRTGEHIIYYRSGGHAITIVRILHVRMDLAGQFEKQEVEDGILPDAP